MKSVRESTPAMNVSDENEPFFTFTTTTTHISSPQQILIRNQKTCQICKKSKSLYTCPACKCETCSVMCISHHKKTKNCTGTRIKTFPVEIFNMNGENLREDLILLEDIEESIDRAKRIRKDIEYKRKKEKRRQ